ncbi:hypothetical protein LUZ63_012844 [Rhynchospora breviuscula]|uniref:F-box domain-containing protein n=1 Tax=Rhynchospora breviuscula TaxID=2022672 RepID=A0A9Q0C7I2_9POAL|nr:hypothetical protein LUZ63_012844 [Rhynchospora breviuscula]
MDRLSDLPDELLVTILSFLPTLTAARTSVLCRRFHRLWERSPFVQIIYGNLMHIDKFVAQADRAILHRNPSYSLLSLHLQLSDLNRSLPDSYLPSLLTKAASLGLCHLSVAGYLHLESTLPCSFSIKTLKSLALPNILLGQHHVLPSGFALTSLKTLSLGLSRIDPAKFNQLLSQLSSLEELQLRINSTRWLTLSSQTIRKLKLVFANDYPEINTLGLGLFLPSLESLHLENDGFLDSLFNIHGEVPLLRTAVINLYGIRPKDASAVRNLLSFISRVEDLSLHIKESLLVQHPVPILLEPGKNMPNFPNLKRLDMGLCFHEHHFAAIVNMLHNCPALELLKLVHEIPRFTYLANNRKRKDWRSKLPRNADGNRRCAYFRGLHLGENRKECMKLLVQKRTFKRHAQHRTRT